MVGPEIGMSNVNKVHLMDYVTGLPIMNWRQIRHRYLFIRRCIYLFIISYLRVTIVCDLFSGISQHVGH